MVLAGLIASLKVLGGTLADHKFLFLGAGEVRIRKTECSNEFLAPILHLDEFCSVLLTLH